MFGLVDLDAIRLQEDHSFTQFAGKVMFGVYSYISVIVLINMLIAMMNTSYQIISVSIKKYKHEPIRCAHNNPTMQFFTGIPSDAF